MKPILQIMLTVVIFTSYAKGYSSADYHEPEFSGWITAWGEGQDSFLDYMMLNGEAARLILQHIQGKEDATQKVIDDGTGIELIEVSYKDWICVKKTKLGNVKIWLKYNFTKLTTGKISGDVVCRRKVF